MNNKDLAQASPTILPKIRQLLLRRSILENKQSLILDAAVGKGPMAKLLIDEFSIRQNQISGIDVFEYENELLKNINFIQHDLNTTLPFPENHFDVCFSIETIEHLERPYFFARELYRVLKPGGTAIISTPNISHILSRIYFIFTGKLLGFRKENYIGSGHITPIYDLLWREQLNKAGFTIKEVVYTPMRIPKLGWFLPLNTQLTGQISIYVLQKNGQNE